MTVEDRMVEFTENPAAPAPISNFVNFFTKSFQYTDRGMAI